MYDKSMTYFHECEQFSGLLGENDNSPGVQGFWTGGNNINDEGSWVCSNESPGKNYICWLFNVVELFRFFIIYCSTFNLVEYTDRQNGQGKSVCKIENKK